MFNEYIPKTGQEKEKKCSFFALGEKIHKRK